jgi:hypothetical protein
MAHDEFISYSDIDRAAADGTSRHPLLDRARDSTPGADWGAAIINAIDHFRCYRSDLSASANRSRQIGREVERAIKLHIRPACVGCGNERAVADIADAAHRLTRTDF